MIHRSEVEVLIGADRDEKNALTKITTHAGTPKGSAAKVERKNQVGLLERAFHAY